MFRDDSKNLEHLIDRTAGDAMAISNGDNSVEPSIFFGSSLVIWSGSHVILRRVHVLPARDAVQDFLRPMAYAEIGHANQHAVVGLHHQPHIQGRRTVGSQRLPVTATRTN